jgi:hypothetical protein
VHCLFALFQFGDHRLYALLGKRIEPLLQKLTVVDDLLLEVLALFAHGLTAGSGGSNALSVIDRCRGRGDDGPNNNRYVWFPALLFFACVPAG